MCLNKVLPAVGFGGDGAAVALDITAAAAPLLVQELPRDLQSGRRQKAVAFPARVDNNINGRQFGCVDER